MIPEINNMRRVALFILISIVIAVKGADVNISLLKAVGDGKTDNTLIIQKAIDSCSLTGGGSVIIPMGTFLTGPIFFKSNVSLFLQPGSVLLGIANLDVYTKAFPNFSSPESPALLYAKNVTNIGIYGTGIIDGQGYDQTFQYGNDPTGPLRPRLIYFRNCTNVTVKDITLQNPAFWTQDYEGCDGVIIKNIKVFAYGNWNNDGLDIDSKNVNVSDCYIESDDDALCLKSDYSALCENITITNCNISTNCNAIKLGTASKGGFKNIKISGCKIQAASKSIIRDWSKIYPWMGIESSISVIGGIAVECVDGGVLDGVNISDIDMTDVQTPIFIRLGDRNRTQTNQISTLKNVSVNNVTAKSNSKMTCSITGIAAKAVENILISNVTMEIRGGGTPNDTSLNVNEVQTNYPENRMFGVILPAYGFYVRHALLASFKNVKIATREPDVRPTFVFDNVQNYSTDSCTSNGTNPTFKLHASTLLTMLSSNISKTYTKTVVGRELTIKSDAKINARLFSPLGRLVNSYIGVNEVRTEPLQSGIYILKINDDSSKIIIK